MAIYFSTVVTMFVLVSVLLLLISSNVSCSFHRRHQHHYMQQYAASTSTSTPAPTTIKPVKFPHIDRIMHRFDDDRMKSTSKPVHVTPQPVRREHDKSRHWEMEQAVLAAHPEMLNDDWMVDEDDDDDIDESAEEEQSHDYKKEPVTRHHHHNQKDEAVAAAAAAASSSSGGSAMTKFKWHTLGTRQDVARTRNRQLTSEKDFQAALQHAVRVLQEGHCQQPKARVVRVSDVYPHPSKTYIPSCTILHQCGDDTGCCSYEGMACVAKHSHPVELFFYTSTVGSGASQHREGGASSTTATVQGDRAAASVEKLLFYNHTECECQRRADKMARDTARHVAAAATLPATPDSRHYLRLPAHSAPPAALAVKPPNIRNFHSSDDDKMMHNKGCRCPNEYSVRYLANGTCVCDCFDRQRECLRFKKGKNSFSVADRNCVLRRECREPACEFGAYIASAGRCPIKWEQYGMTFHHIPPSAHHIEQKPVEHPKPPAHSPSSSLLWSPKPTERPLHWVDHQRMDHHQKPASPWDKSTVSWETHKPASSHWSSSSEPKTALAWSPSSRSSSYASWAEQPKPVASPLTSWSQSRSHVPSWGAEQSKATQQQYPAWPASDSSRSSYPWSRTESRPSNGGYAWNPAETARKPVPASTSWSSAREQPPKPAPSGSTMRTTGGRDTRDTRLPTSRHL